MAETLVWWLVVQALALTGLPIAFVLFRRLPDSGYAFAKPLSLLLGGYVFWLALSLNVLPNRPGSVFWAFFFVAVVSLIVLWPRREEFAALVKERWPLFLAIEVLFTVALFTGAHLRSFIPEISGTEKPMDFMFLNASDRSRYYPPDDPWFAGFSVSYYYFGYVIQSMIGKLAFQPTPITYNLALAGTAAMAATAAFGLGYNLTALARRAAARLPYLVGGAAVVLVLILGNLEGVLEFMAANGIGSREFLASMGIAGLDQAQESARLYPTEQSSFWWWWRATRISPDAGTITEFPFFSFLLGDLHPHVMAIPFVLTAVALGLALWRSEEPLDMNWWLRRPAMFLVSGLVIGALAFLNAWDLPTFGFLAAVLVAVRNRALAGEWPRAMRASAAFVIPLGVVAVLLYLPFYLGFSSQASGLRAVESVATRPLHAALFWAPLFILALPAPLVVLSRTRRNLPREYLNAALALLVALFVLWALLIATDGSNRLNDALSARGWNWLTALFFAAGVAISGLALLRATEDEETRDSPLVPALAMTTTAMLLILGSELFFIRDVFNSRLNTVFKLYYQAWLLLGVAGAYGAYWLLSEWLPANRSARQFLRGAWAGAAALAVAGALLYPIGATLSRTESLSRPGRTLDGLAAARRDSPDDYNAAQWLRQRADREDRVLEAVGGPYSAFGRVAAWTGIPTVLGWGGHEIQWGRSPVSVGERQNDVNLAYSTQSLAEAEAILRKYGVTYVFVGSLERTTYPAAGLEKFQGAFPSVYSVGSVVIYRVPADLSDGGRSTGAAGR
jgi:YYY domain-containing protein